jgi:hypothetical protein
VRTDVDPGTAAEVEGGLGIDLVVAASAAVAAARRASAEPLDLRLRRDVGDVVLSLRGPGVAGGQAAASLERHARRLGGEVARGSGGDAETVELRIPA